jgi:mannose/fructose/N-acetylgalactosamine-specific phosphotransferase system component IIB
VNENSIRALIQNELMNEIAKNPIQKAAFLQAFPSGSQQEAELIQKAISDLEQGLYDSFPTIAHFGRGRAK